MLTAGEGIVQIQTLQVFKRIRGEPTGMDDDEDPKLCRLYPERREGAVGQFAPGHIGRVAVTLVRAACGVMGERMRLECPLCGRRICVLYYRDGRAACRRCNSLWYKAQRASSYRRKALAKRRIRRKLGDYGQLWATKRPPKPHGMWRRTYARYCASLERIERKVRSRV